MPAEWVWEAGVGETRAALIDDDAILAARIERDGALREGTVCRGRLLRMLPETNRAVVRLDGGEEVLLRPAPRLSEGAAISVVITREPIPEEGRLRPAHARLAEQGAAAAAAPTLAERLGAGGVPVRRLLSHQPDALEAAGWSELLDEAASGAIAFTGGLLRLSLTPAMTLFDVDGQLGADALAVAGARAAAVAIRRLDIGGSIGVDLPTVAKPARAAAAAAVDAILPQPFERTAVNGFGFLQIVRPRSRASIPELVRGNPALSAALALLRRAEREPLHGRRTLVAASAVLARIMPEWQAELARRLGTDIGLRADADLPISGGYVEPAR
ncbi:ribonuclease [Sphingomonas jatrophae]|uniref:Uncharacterized protein n=1 Tax=Sphingomonas jatrophae TaxID=1166337 RepID=A0A1I6LKC5_9SPHN|nr:ribonuclease [Sphingomonas jatrophae]SFS03987.1 hypothetical protein SAMN05192580_2860 [Sphingomonas jatrophae]